MSRLLSPFDVLSKVIPPLPLGERVRVRGKKGIGYLPTPPPFPSPLKREGFHSKGSFNPFGDFT